jgi:hypothetical protein
MRLYCHSSLTPFCSSETVHLERAESPPMIFCVCAGFEAAEFNEDSLQKMRRGTSLTLALEY